MTGKTGNEDARDCGTVVHRQSAESASVHVVLILVTDESVNNILPKIILFGTGSLKKGFFFNIGRYD
jgi:hypothetical protein